jgi:hypothetical protein
MFTFNIGDHKWKLTQKNGIVLSKDIMNDIVSTGNVLGSGGFGMVKKLISRDGTDNKFSIKFSDIESDDHRVAFYNEIEVGSNIKLKENFIGPSIYAYTTFRVKNILCGAYIMDHWERGMQNVKSMTLMKYFQTIQKSCPLPKSDIIYRLEHLLLSFYKITEGYHGDLHAGNIAVILDMNNNILYLQIYDYGAHQKFRYKNKIKKCNTLTDVFSLIESDINNNIKNKTNNLFQNNNNIIKYFPKNSNARVFIPNYGQPYRPNVNVLKFVNKYSGSSKEKGISLYNALVQNKQLMKKINIIKKIANITNKGITIKSNYNNLLTPNQKNKITINIGNSPISVLDNIVSSVIKLRKSL